jgi:23S rRNA (uracil1939-C5)-methyltransferase
MMPRRPARSEPPGLALTHDLVVEGLAAGGDGVARLGDVTVFLPRVAPGDRVRARVPATRGRWVRAEVVALLAPGPDRQPPACAVFAECGGCQWHHVRYAAQVAAKRALVERALRQARVAAPGPVDCVSAGPPLGYRQRARLRIGPDGPGGRLGFLADRSHRVVPITACPVLRPDLERALPRLQDLPATVPDGSELALLVDAAGRVAAELRPAGDVPAGLAADLLARWRPTVCGLRVGPGPDADAVGDVVLDLSAPGERPFLADPGTFAQVSPEASARIRATVAGWVPGDAARIVELHAGSGNLTRDLVTRGPVLAVESDARAAALARTNLAGLPVELRCAPAGAVVSQLRAAGARVDVVVLDPPRTGAREVLADLAGLAPGTLVYVSCDPMTFARDTHELIARGYALTDLTVIDTLPQTDHLELVARLAPRPR